MQERRYAFVFPAAILLLALTGQSVLGFSLTGARRGSSDEQEFKGLGFEIAVRTDRVRRTEQNELDELLEFLNNTTFSQRYEFGAGSELSGTFNIRRNTPCKPEIFCFDTRGGVGAVFDLTFRSRGRDPIISPINSNLHWIQWVSADYSSVAPNYEFIDIYSPLPRSIDGRTLLDPNTFPSHPTPYYPGRIIPDRNRPGNLLFNFFDRPYIRNFAYNHDWDYQLYLAEENLRRDNQTGEIFREVTVYNGISWGWTNTRTRLPSNGGNNGGGNGGGGGIGSGGSGGGGIASSFSAREVPLFDNDSEEGAPDVEKIEKVPEATSLFGLFALSGWGIFQWLKNRKDK